MGTSRGNQPKEKPRRISDVELLREYRRVQMKLGVFPSRAQLTAHSEYDAATYARRFGGWDPFRQMMGDRSPRFAALTKAELIAEFYIVKEKIGRPPTCEELGSLGRYGVRTYHKHFGGHQKLLEFLGESTPTLPATGHVEKQLKRVVSTLKEEARRRPKATPFAGGSVSLSEAQRQIIYRYCVVRAQAGRPLTINEAVARNVCDKAAFLEHFGGFSSFLMLVGDA